MSENAFLQIVFAIAFFINLIALIYFLFIFNFFGVAVTSVLCIMYTSLLSMKR